MTAIGRLIISITVAIVLAGSAYADDEGIEIIKGKLSDVTKRMARQLLSVKNNRTTVIGTLGVSCAFFRGGELVGKGGSVALNVKPGETVYLQIGDVGTFGADRTECRVDYATGPYRSGGVSSKYT